MSKLTQLIHREPVRVAYIVVIIAEAIASALLAALSGHPANLSAFGLAFVTALAGEAARAKVTPVTVSAEDSAVSSVLADLSKVPAISPYVADVESLIPPAERQKLEGLVTKTAEQAIGKAIGLSDEDLNKLVALLEQRGLVAVAAPPAPVAPGDPTETAPEPGQDALATPPAPQTQPTPGQ